jgi:beta-glucosidase
MVLGEHGLQSGGRSRTEIDLPGVQQELLEAVYKMNPNIVLVLKMVAPLAIHVGCRKNSCNFRGMAVRYTKR